MAQSHAEVPKDLLEPISVRAYFISSWNILLNTALFWLALTAQKTGSFLALGILHAGSAPKAALLLFSGNSADKATIQQILQESEGVSCGRSHPSRSLRPAKIIIFSLFGINHQRNMTSMKPQLGVPSSYPPLLY